MPKNYFSLLLMLSAYFTTASASAQINAQNDLGWAPTANTTLMVVANVLENDQLNGTPATLSQVTLTVLSAPNPFVQLEPDGSVFVTQGTSPEGTHFITYQICETANPDNCTTATVAVTIGGCQAPPLVTVAPATCDNEFAFLQFSGAPLSTFTYVYNGSFPLIVTSTANGSVSMPALPGNYQVYFSGDCQSLPVSVNVDGVNCGLTIEAEVSYTDLNSDGHNSPGDLVTYNFSVTNNGITTATNVDITSDDYTINGGPIPTLASGATDSTTFSTTHVVTQADINSGNINGFSLLTYTSSTGTAESLGFDLYYTLANDGIVMMAFRDNNGNGIREQNEPLLAVGDFHYQLNADESVQVYSTAHFNLYESNPANTYTLGYSLNPAYLGLYTVANSTYTNVTVAEGSGLTTYYFALTPTPFTDVAVAIMPDGAPPRPGFVYYNRVTLTNNGTLPVASGTITFTSGSNVTVVSSNPGGTLTATSATFDFTDLVPYETRQFIIGMQVPVIPIVELGQLVSNSASVTTPPGDVLPGNNYAAISQVIVGSYDPNDKTESHGPEIVYSSFSETDYLNYTIQFENTGTANAVNIRIEDILDEKLDAESIVMQSASHDYILERNGNLLTWRFNAIELPPSQENSSVGKGYVNFSIRPSPGYAIGDMIPNVAEIYFDFNPPIVTNISETTFVAQLNIPRNEIGEILMYPNPVHNHANISSQQIIDSVTVTDMLGKIVIFETVNANDKQLNVSALSNGVYLVKTASSKSFQTMKLIKQ